MLTSERGMSKIAVLLYLGVVVFVFYVFLKVIPPYMDYYAMDDEAGQEIHMATMNSDNTIISDLYKRAQERNLPITRDDIVLTREPGGTITIDIKWTKVVDFGYDYKREFNFEVYETTGNKERQ